MFNGLSVLECPALGIVQEYLVLCSVFSVFSHVLYFESVLTQLFYWRASVASETLTGVTQSKIGDVCLFIYIYGRTYVILYFDPPYFCVRSAFDPVPNFTKQNLPV